MNVVKNIICELTGYRPGSVDVSQGDRGSRAVSCRLLENGAAWMIPEGATARVAYTLPDGTEGLYDRRPDGTPMWEISKNTVTVELADQLMAQAGMVQMSILILGPEGGQLATWPIRVMVSANKAARLTVPEEMPPYGAGFAGKIFFGGVDGTITPLGIGEGVEIVRQEDGTFALVAYGGSGGGGGINEEKDPTVYEWAKQPQKPPYTAEEVGALPKGTKIPDKTSELTNDAGFVTRAVGDLENYFTKKQTQELIAAIPRFRVTVVQQLPAAGEDLVLYLVPFATAEGQYLEYIWVDGRWEIIGSQRVDLTGYATEVWVKDYVAEHSGQNPPQDGEDGFSPIATVTQTAEGATISITDANGTTTATVTNGKDGDDGYTPKKGVDYFDGSPGKDGYTPVKGKDYSDGADGFSPTVAVNAIPGGRRISITDKGGSKTVDVMDGEDGDPGDPGRGIKSIARTSGNGAAGTVDTYTITYTDNTAGTFQVRNGSNGAAGKAATFEITGVTALEYGATPTVTEQSGSTAQARKYSMGIPAGKPGTPGKDGFTPIKGVDYYTAEDKAEYSEYIAAELAKRGQLKPEFANSIEECTDTSKLYVLPDGYIYAYMLIEREVSTGGGYTNLAKTFDESRLNSSGALTATTGAWACVEYIGLLSIGDVIRIKGFGACTDYNSSVYNEAKVVQSSAKLNAQSGNGEYSYDSTTGIATFTVSGAACKYMRFSGKLTGTTDDVIITINEEITEGGTEIITEYAWANTGHAFVPADYEPRILTLEEDVLQLKNMVGTQGGSTSEAMTPPAYWESEVEAKAATINALQEAGGKNCVCFAWAADLHIDDNDNGRTTDIGKVIATMLDRCHIPWAVLSGDINTRASYGTEAGLLEAQAAMPEHLAPLWGTNRLLLGLGNHDGCWGDSSGYYRHQFPPERMWNVFFRWQALDSRRVFSDDGLYFYVDDTAQKTRFIVLNSNFGGEYAEDGNGWAVNNRFGTSCYGQEQLDWLADVALDMPEGYGAVITAHVPPNITYTVDKAQLIGIVNAYNAKTTFSGSYTAGVEGWSNSAVSVDFKGAKGEIIAMFAGHVHGDSVDTTTMSCPIITILSAGASANEAYADTAPTRTPGTATETSFDVVTINRKTRTIYCTRVGAGDDREVSY